ncbi:MAG: hypothetical protein IT437_02050 [Phycisphaerales bacterium]|nr:hypothetical protein [Phycisphaerales bacterium]
MAAQGYERRIWRLAFLLTGDAERAAGVIETVLRDQPHPEGVDAGRLDRLIILHAREVPRGTVPAVGMGAEAARGMGVLLALPQQPREAWVLTRLDGLDELRVSRAMDCSRTAVARHLKAADEQMGHRLGDALNRCVAALRREADAIDPAPLIAAALEKRRKDRLGRALVVGGITLIVVAAAAIVALRWLV